MTDCEKEFVKNLMSDEQVDMTKMTFKEFIGVSGDCNYVLDDIKNGIENFDTDPEYYREWLGECKDCLECDLDQCESSYDEQVEEGCEVFSDIRPSCLEDIDDPKGLFRECKDWEFDGFDPNTISDIKNMIYLIECVLK